jgi:hypothetical protein
MVAKRISELEPIDVLTGEELIPAARSGENFTVRIRDIRSLFSKTDIGLGNVDNTPDYLKPISDPMRVALNAKAAIDHTHPMTAVQGLTSALSGKADATHVHTVENVTGLTTALSGKAALVHTHVIDNVTGLTSALAGKAAIGHTHIVGDIAGLTDSLDSLTIQIAGKSNANHVHDINDVTGLRTALNNKASAVHTHNVAEIQDIQGFVDDAIANSTALTGDVAVLPGQW